MRVEVDVDVEVGQCAWSFDRRAAHVSHLDRLEGRPARTVDVLLDHLIKEHSLVESRLQHYAGDFVLHGRANVPVRLVLNLLQRIQHVFHRHVTAITHS